MKKFLLILLIAVALSTKNETDVPEKTHSEWFEIIEKHYNIFYASLPTNLRNAVTILKKHKVYKKLKKDFISYKRSSILYWLYKITDKRAKLIYLILILFSMPSCYLEPLTTFKRELWLLTQIILNNNKRIVFWGASIFLECFISKYKISNENIIGIIDKNPAKHNKFIGKYLCYPPENWKDLNADIVIITIVNFSKSNQQSIREFLKETGKEIIVKSI